MPSAAPAASRPMPRPAPMTARPRPMPAPMYASANPSMPFLRETGSSTCPEQSSVMSVNGHADEHGREQRKHVRLHENNDDFQSGQGDRERQRQEDKIGRAHV